MRVTYKSEEDVLHILFRDAPIERSEQHRPGLILDYDCHGGLIALELHAASTQVSHLPRAQSVEILPASLESHEPLSTT